MGEPDSLETPSLLLRTGRLLFALSVILSGTYQLVTDRFVNLVPVRPGPLPLPWPPYLFGVLLVLIGTALLVRKAVSAAAIMLGVLLLVLFFGFGLPVALAHASTGYVWVDPLMMLMLLGGVSLAATPREGSPGSSLDRAACYSCHTTSFQSCLDRSRYRKISSRSRIAPRWSVWRARW